MALCFAHAAAGYLAGDAWRRDGESHAGLPVLGAVLGVAPDLDFLPGLVVGDPMAFHRGVTHTVLAAVVVAAVAWAGSRRWPGGAGIAASRVAWVAFGAWASHLLLDVMSVDARAPHGVQALWPLVSVWVHAPVPVFREILVDASGRGAFVGSLVSTEALTTWVRELALALVVVAGWRTLRLLVVPQADDGVEPAGES